jgi:Na+-transporting methylmalonyl-CoA/oxaloacetate decarboxylase gamma subunit
MSESMLIALQIAAVGMGLVFTSILLLWLVISLLVRVTAVSEPVALPTDQPDLQMEQERKRQAAATAVALALALESNNQPNLLPLPPTPIVSAWQAVMRSSILDKRGPVR